MENTYKFITHVVNNLFPLNEYSEGEIARLMTQFKEEAEDFDIKISDEQLRKYIERFDQLKNSPKIQEKDLRKWSLAKLIKLITSSEGAEVEDKEEIDATPDVVYDENGYVVWNGSKEGNCINYGRGEKWCITRGSFGNYRYSEQRGYPTFYLAKNTNLPDSDKLSFVAIQVRDVSDEGKRYVYTNRQNSPYESNPMSFSGLTSEVPWLTNIPNIKSLLKYIPLSKSEKVTQVYGNKAVSIRDWANLPFSEKKQYLVVRKEKNNLFDDITNSEFVSNYLPNYPQIATFIAVSPGLINPIILLKNLDKFSSNDRKSVTANLHDNVNLEELSKDTLPFDVKKLLTILNKWDISINDRLYVTKNGEAIVKLTFGDNIKVGVFTEERDYPNIKLNKRTSKFLIDYPELDKIPFNSLLKLANDEVIDKSLIDRILQAAEKDPNSAIAVKDTENGKIILDSNTFTSYKVEGDKIVPIPFDSEEVQNILSSEEDSSGFQESAVNLLFNSKKENLPSQIDKDSFINLLKNTPYSKRTRNGFIVIPSSKGIAIIPTNYASDKLDDESFGFGNNKYGGGVPWNHFVRTPKLDTEVLKLYFDYLRSQNLKYTDEQLLSVLRGVNKKEFIAANPPMVENSMYKPAVFDDTSYLVNVQNPRESKRIGSFDKIIKANLTSSQAQRILGTTVQAPATQAPTAATPAAAPTQAGAPRRGRPAGGARPAVPAVQGGTGTEQQMEVRGLTTAWNGLPVPIRTRLSNVVQEPGISRGASRRNNQLGTRGRVMSTWNAGPSSIYFIRLASGTTIASINVQPGNINYILVPGQAPIRLNSPAQLVAALQQRNLAEILIAEFMVSNPTKLTETKKILNYYIKSKNRKK